jgi:DNA-binding XRE family transcriptional regulator
MNKHDTKQARTEIRTLKSGLNKAQKGAAKAIAAHRKTIRSTEISIAQIEREITCLTRTTTDRIAIIENRLHS